jgi:hypothetical protein
LFIITNFVVKKLTVMKQILSILLLFLSLNLHAEKTLKVSVSNPSDHQRTEYVVIPISAYGVVRSALVTAHQVETPCQLDDLDQDERYDELCFQVVLDKKEKKEYVVTLMNEGQPRQYEPKVYAEMLVRNDKVKEKNKHDNFLSSITVRGDCANSYNILHHHGVAFESELNGIRIYFDKRQTLDLYGKYHKRLELKETQFYTSKEQKAEGYGDDVLWVGNTFGLGAFRGWNGQEPTMVDPVKNRTQRVISYGPLRTIVEVVDQGWVADASLPPVNMTIRYTQYAGHRDTDVDVFFSHDVSDYTFSTGIINVKGSEEYNDKKGLRACWGTDWPASDTVNWKRETVGLGILVPQKHIVSIEPANKDNYATVVATKGKKLSYKIIYCSDNETFGYHSANDWFNYLKLWRKEVETPVAVSVR